MAVLYVEHLVEGPGDVEAGGIAVGKLFAGTHLLECEPAAIGEGVFHLVAISVNVLRTEYRHYPGILDFGDTVECILDLPLLGFDLELIGQMLPPAAATSAEVLASRLNANIRR